jgi:hypothetical protein
VGAGQRPGHSRLGSEIADEVATSAKSLGWNLAPHDLRRNFAKLARSGRAPLEDLADLGL